MKNTLVGIGIFLIGAMAQAQVMGSLQVSGEAGKSQIFQKVKAVRCEKDQRGKCDTAVFFDLNKPQALKAGNYIVGFENSIYPGWVTVEAGGLTQLNLEKVAVPSQITGSKIKVYRDMSAAVEQNKVLFAMYAMNKHFFRLDKENFGDLYLTGAWERDFVQRFTYEICPKIENYTKAPEEAVVVCTAWNTATDYSGLRPLYTFNVDGTIVESWVTFPGDVITSKHLRYLVSTPMSAADFVAVFPGVYSFQGNASRKTVSVTAGQFSENF